MASFPQAVPSSQALASPPGKPPLGGEQGTYSQLVTGLALVVLFHPPCVIITVALPAVLGRTGGIRPVLLLKKLAQRRSVTGGGGALFRHPPPPPLSCLLPPLPPSRDTCASVSAFSKAALAPSAILQPLQHPPKMLLLLPEAGRPALFPGHSPPSGAPGPRTGVRTTSLPSPTPVPFTSLSSAPTQLLATLVPIPIPSASLPGTLGPPSQLQEVTPSLPRGLAATQMAPRSSACWHLGAMYESGSHWTEPGCFQCWCQVGGRDPGGALVWHPGPCDGWNSCFCLQNGEVTCEKVTCEAPCSHPIPSEDGGCCPSCAGGSWSGEGCEFPTGSYFFPSLVLLWLKDCPPVVGYIRIT